MTVFLAQVLLIVVGGFCVAAGAFLLAILFSLVHKLVVKVLGLDKNEKL